MKNKRMKLTALAMSVLMAMSTITSVTWAADLFTDGAPAEEIVEKPTEAVAEEPADFVSDGETVADAVEVEPTEDEALLGTEQGNVVWYDAWGDKDDPVWNGDGYKDHAIGAYKTDENGYKVHVKVNKAWKDVDATFIASEPATCEHPAREKVSFTLKELGDFEAYSYSKQELKNYDPTAYHKIDAATVEKRYMKLSGTPFNGATCDKNGKLLAYRQCIFCGAVYNRDSGGFDPVNDLEKVARDAYGDNAGAYATTYFEVVDDFATGHVAGKVETTTVPPTEVNGVGYGDYDYPGYEASGKMTKQAWFDWKANCVKTGSDTFSGATDATRDAFYYEITYCKNKDCGKVIGVTKHVFYRANITEGTEIYVAVKNVFGFINKNLRPGQDGYIRNGWIEKDNFGGVVLDNCAVAGVYDLGTTSKDFKGDTVGVSGYSVVETITQPAGHQWYPIGYPKDGISALSPSTIYDFAEENRDYATGGLKLDKKGEIHSVNCSTTAYYSAVQHCMNPKCKYAEGKESNPDIAGRRKALAGDHVWYTENETDYDGHTPGRYVDITKTEYTQILDDNGEVDPKHHMEHYKDHVQCKLCHKVDWVESNTPDRLVDHIMVPKEVEGTRVEATCGTTGSYDRQDVCICGYTDESTRTTVTIPATDNHNFGNNPAQIVWSGGKDDSGDGGIFIKGDYIDGISLHADIVRKCTVCGELDSNGINTMVPGKADGSDIDFEKYLQYTDRNYDDDHWNNTTLIPAGKWCATLHVKDLVPAKADPATGISYRCSTAHATIYVDWVGTVDGKVTKLSDSKENVPYYESTSEYQARAAHTPGTPKKENLEADGSYDEVVRCTVCGDIVSKEHKTVSKIPAPTVTAKSANYNTINISWDAIEGASSYRLYYKSAALGVNTWTLVRNVNGTSFNHTALVTGVKYRYTVRAVVDGELGEFSKTGSVASAKLSAPVLNSVTSVAKGKKLSWSKVDGASGYIIQKDGKRVATVKGGAKVTWTDKKASAGSTYKVRAYRTVYKANYDKTNVYGPFSAAK